MSVGRARALSRRSRQLLKSLDDIKSVAGLSDIQIENVEIASENCFRQMETEFIDSISTSETNRNDAMLIENIISGIGVIQYARRKMSDRINRRFRD
jgi:hypothetical protein